MTLEMKRTEVGLGAEKLTDVELFEVLKNSHRSDFFTGLPCGELREFIDKCFTDREVLHMPATNEREAVGIAAGSWLVGKEPTVYMQNSGLFLSSNDIGSLVIACKMPITFVVSWRGVPGETATQHFATGSATEALLQSFHMDYVTKPTSEGVENLLESKSSSQMPVCILKKRERFNTPPSANPGKGTRTQAREVIKGSKEFELMSRDEALSIIMPIVGKDTAVISSTGLISRSIFEYHDGQNQFYNAGAFGITSSIGLGIAASKPDLSTIVIEGDGSLLADIGSLNLIGHYAPKNFMHVVLDNKAYASCSGEPTFGSDLIPRLACEFGYSRVYSVQSKDDISDVFLSAHNVDGPQLIHIAINTVGKRNYKRPVSMDQNARRFRKHFSC